MSRILGIPDPHEPYCKEGYLDFCEDMYRAWDCDGVVFLGDIIDSHAISFHAKHPEADGALAEYIRTKEQVKKWHKAFPNAKVCIGNHDERIVRLAESVNIPKRFLRDYNEIWETPTWEWDFSHTIDDVYYFHGTGYGGMHPAFNAARQMSMSVVMGHCHSAGGIKWLVNPNKRWFGMDVGCGIDDKAVAFAYGRHMKKRSVISCGVVIDGVPYFEVMPLEDY